MASIALTAARVASYAAAASEHTDRSSSLGGQRAMWCWQRAALRVWTTSMLIKSV
jgi:hypothetical protein